MKIGENPLEKSCCFLKSLIAKDRVIPLFYSNSRHNSLFLNVFRSLKLFYFSSRILKNFAICLLALSFLSVFPKLSLAALVNVSSKTFTAAALSSNSGTVSLNIQLQNLTGGTTSQIWWDASAITPGSTQWRRADACIVLYSNITSTSGAIQIYTDNKAADANPQYTGGNTKCAGLVQTDSTISDTLPMCWRITDVSTNTLTIEQTGAHLYSVELGSSFYCFFSMKDKGSTGTDAMTNGESYITVKEAFIGMQYAESSWSNSMTSPNYIYLGANFSTAKTGKTYKTSTLRIEGFSE